ncbi:MAG: radical SAM protein [Hornefia sp.]|nr:radical SAM protein [Hornefia sp.]
MFTSGIIEVDGTHYNESPFDNETVDESEDYEGQIIQELEEKNQIYSATFELTYDCNERCIHCYANFPTEEKNVNVVSLQKYKSVIDELYAMKCLHLAFTGGDPFLYEDFFEVFKYSRSKGFVCDIFTNGLYLYNNSKTLDEILSLRPRAFYISLYGSNPETHDYITNVVGSFKKTTEVIKKIKAAEIPVVLNVMVLNTNCHDVQGIMALAEELGVDYRISISVINRNDGDATPNNYRVKDTETIGNILRIVNKKLYSMDKESTVYTRGEYMCGAGVTSLCISPDGTVFPCVSLKNPLGNIYEDSLTACWNGEPRKKLRDSLKWEKTKECYNCKYSEVCLHCAGISQAETGDMLSCNECDKDIAKCRYGLFHYE